MDKRGIAALSDADLVAILLGSGVEGRNVQEISNSVTKLIVHSFHDHIGEASNVFSTEDFEKISGIGTVKAKQIVCSLELGRRLFSAQNMQHKVIRCRDDVIREVGNLVNKKQEHVVVLLLDGRSQLIGKQVVAVGTSNISIVTPRDVFEPAISLNAVGIVLVHNHPSGCIEPSNADKRFTERIRKAGQLLGIELLDHVIV